MNKLMLTAVFQEAEEGGYACWIEEIPEAISQGDTLAEAKANLEDALNLILEYKREKSTKEHSHINESSLIQEKMQIAAIH